MTSIDISEYNNKVPLFKNNGFTLIEIIILLIVIVILGAIFVPNYMNLRVRALEAATKRNMHVVQRVVETFSTMAEGMYPGNLDITVGEVLYAKGYVDDPGINNLSICGGIGQRICPPIWPSTAILRSQINFSNRFDKSLIVIMELPNGPPAIPPSGCVYYTAQNIDPTGTFCTEYTISAYGAKKPIPLILMKGE